MVKKKLASVFIAAVLVGSSFIGDVYASERHASVVVVNETDTELSEVSVVHKYSSDNHEVKSWENVAPGATTSSFSVKYETGLFTTGKDWWIVSWRYKGQPFLIYTDPNNLTSIADTLGDVLSAAGGSVVGALLAVVTENPLAGKATSALVYYKLRAKDSNVGWKQHILVKEDDGRTTRVLVRNNDVVWDSPSGQSSTDDLKREQ